MVHVTALFCLFVCFVYNHIIPLIFIYTAAAATTTTTIITIIKQGARGYLIVMLKKFKVVKGGKYIAEAVQYAVLSFCVSRFS